jgi:2-iminobutanoate/2-iminopropanoate deaminase
MKTLIGSFENSPPALGPYSLGVVAEGRMVFVSGMVPFNPALASIERGTIGRQTELVIENIRRVLAQANATLENVVSCRVYLSDLNPDTFAQMNEVYVRYFATSKPARATVGTALLGFDVEIECIAVIEPA